MQFSSAGRRFDRRVKEGQESEQSNLGHGTLTPGQLCDSALMPQSISITFIYFSVLLMFPIFLRYQGKGPCGIRCTKDEYGYASIT